MNRLKSIDLFAGIGGIRLGFDRAFGPGTDPAVTIAALHELLD